MGGWFHSQKDVFFCVVLFYVPEWAFITCCFFFFFSTTAGSTLALLPRIKRAGYGCRFQLHLRTKTASASASATLHLEHDTTAFSFHFSCSGKEKGWKTKIKTLWQFYDGQSERTRGRNFDLLLDEVDVLSPVRLQLWRRGRRLSSHQLGQKSFLPPACWEVPQDVERMWVESKWYVLCLGVIGTGGGLLSLMCESSWHPLPTATTPRPSCGVRVHISVCILMGGWSWSSVENPH